MMNQQEQLQDLDQQKLQDETEFIIEKFREGNSTMELRQLVGNFLEFYIIQGQLMLDSNKYKSCYAIYKKLEKVLSIAIKAFGLGIEGYLLCYKEQVSNLLDVQRQFGPNEKSQILKHNLELSKDQLKVSNKDDQSLKLNLNINQDPRQCYEVYKYLVRHLVSILNNIGVIYVLRKKYDEAIIYFSRAILGRIQDFDSYLSFYQTAILATNIAFAYKTKENYNEAGQLLNKAILNLENIDKLTNQNKSHSLEVCINPKQMIPLLELFYNKLEKKLLPEPREIQTEKILHFLALSYHFYGEIFKLQEKDQESQFCTSQFDFLQNLFYKMNPNAPKMIQEESETQNKINSKDQISKSKLGTKNKSIPKQRPNQGEENFSTVSFKTFNPATSISDNEISKDKIVFQKYIEINQDRFKVVILQMTNIGCIQILLYNKPLNYLKSIVIPYNDMLEFAEKKKLNAFSNEVNLENFFKTLIRNLYLKNDELHIKDLNHFATLDDFLNFTNEL